MVQWENGFTRFCQFSLCLITSPILGYKRHSISNYCWGRGLVHSPNIWQLLNITHIRRCEYTWYPLCNKTRRKTNDWPHPTTDNLYICWRGFTVQLETILNIKVHVHWKIAHNRSFHEDSTRVSKSPHVNNSLVATTSFWRQGGADNRASCSMTSEFLSIFSWVKGSLESSVEEPEIYGMYWEMMSSIRCSSLSIPVSFFWSCSSAKRRSAIRTSRLERACRALRLFSLRLRGLEMSLLVFARGGAEDGRFEIGWSCCCWLCW